MAKHRSENSQMFACVFGLALWAAGVPRQTIDILSKLGLTPAYSTLRAGRAALSTECMDILRAFVRDNPSLFTYDNLQISSSIFIEQREDAIPKVACGTMWIIYALRNPARHLIAPILANRDALPEIDYAKDVRPSSETWSLINDGLTKHIVDIFLVHSLDFAPLAAAYRESEILQQIAQRPPPSRYRTRQFPGRVTTTAENSAYLNAKLWEEIWTAPEQLGMDPTDSRLNDYAQPSMNDQATNALIRAAQTLRKGDANAFFRLETIQLAPGFFHVELNLVWNLLHTHRGSSKDLGSLQSLFDFLEKKRLGSHHPDYHTLKSALMQILDGIMLHAWDLEIAAAGFASATAFAASKPSAKTLLDFANRILKNHASTPEEECRTNPDDPNSLDGILHNTKLLLRDLLYFRLLHESIQSGDFGRVELLLGVLTTLFCGAGAQNYCSEFLNFILNLKSVWTPEFA